MVHVSGPRLGQLDDRGDAFTADVRGAIEKIVATTVPHVHSVDDLIMIRPRWTRAVNASLLKHLQSAWLDSATDTHEQLIRAAERVLQGSAATLQTQPPVVLAAAFEVPMVSSNLAELYLENSANKLFSVGDLVWSTARTQMLEGMKAGESITEIRKRLETTVGLAGK